MDINNIMNLFGDNEISAIGNKIGADKASTQSAIQTAVPTLLSALNNNAGSGGAGGILSALDRDHDGSILDDIGGFFQSEDNRNGEGILKHVLGSNETAVTQNIAAQSGISANGASELLKNLAPVIMGYLGKQKQQQGVTSEGGLGDLLSNVIGQASSSGFDIGKIIGSFTGSSDTGKTQNNNSGGIGGMLDQLFGK